MIPNPYVLLAGVLLIFGALTGGYFKGRTDANAAWQLQVAAKEREAHLKERQLQEEANAIQNKLQADKDLFPHHLQRCHWGRAFKARCRIS